jgi:hypothetical protein
MPITPIENQWSIEDRSSLNYPFLKVHKREIRLDRDFKYWKYKMFSAITCCSFRFILIFLKDTVVISNHIVD